MSPAALLLSIVCSAAVAASLAILGVVGQRTLLPHWHGSAAWTGAMAIGLCTAVGVGQALGAVGLLERWAIVGVMGATAVAAVVATRGWSRPVGPQCPLLVPAPETATPARSGPAMIAGVTFAVLVVGAVWVARTVIVLREGIVDPDSLGYHLPLTQDFARDGHADSTLVPNPDVPVYTYPANDELVSSIALLLSHSVVFTALKNLLFAVGVVVAAHAIGIRARAGPAAIAATAAVLGTPAAAFTVAGTGKNDAIAVLAVVLGLGCLIYSEGRTAALILAAACGGVAVGTKLSSVVPGAAVVVWALVVAYRAGSSRGVVRRPGPPVLVLLAALATGGPWYLRNYLTYRNPVPLVRLSVGPVHLPYLPLDLTKGATSVAHFLLRGRHIDILLRGLRQGVGSVGLLLVLACMAGVVVGLRGPGWRRSLAATGAVLLLAYLTTPASAYVLGGRPVQFAVAINLHYAMPAAAVCLLALVVSLPARLAAWGIAALCVAVTLAGLHVGIALTYWATHLGGAGFRALLVAAAVGAAAAGLRQAQWTRWRLALTLAVAIGVTGVIGVAASRPAQQTEDPVVRYLAHTPPSRIVAETAYGTLYGPGGRHHVILPVAIVKGVAMRFTTCRSWKAAVVARHADDVAVGSFGRYHDWVAADPAFVLAATDSRVQLYAVKGAPDPTCRLLG